MPTKPDSLNRRDLMKWLGLTMTGSLLLPAIARAEPSVKRKPVFIPVGEGRKGKMGDNSIVFKLDKSQTLGNLGSSEILLKKGYLGSIPHYHKTFDEVCIVLQGLVTIKVADQLYQVKAGGWHLRPRGSIHCFWNSGDEDAKFIELYIPGGHEEFMKQLTDLFITGTIPSHEQITQLGERFDTHFAWDQLQPILDTYHVHL